MELGNTIQDNEKNIDNVNNILGIHVFIYNAFGDYSIAGTVINKPVITGGRTVRSHKGIVQSGGNKGRLKKGYKYSGQKLKSGLSQIIKTKRNKQ